MEDDNRKLYPMLMLPVDPKKSGNEVYTLADLGAIDTMVDNGWLGGNSMGEIMETYLDRVSGENPFEFYGTQFPVLVKTIKTEETTPVRVNVGDEEAEQRYDSFGKTSVVHRFRRPGGEGLHGFQGRRIRRRALSKMPDGRCPLPSQRD